MNPRRRYGLYLEISGPGSEARAASLGVSQEQRAELEHEFRGAFSVMTRAVTLVERFGPPQQTSADAMRYDLEVRDGLVFEFSIAGDPAIITGSSYHRVEPRACPSGVTKAKSASEAKETGEALVAMRATAAELRRWLGTPDLEYGWWPHDTWCYGAFLSLELRLGIVESWSNDPATRKALESK